MLHGAIFPARATTLGAIAVPGPATSLPAQWRRSEPGPPMASIWPCTTSAAKDLPPCSYTRRASTAASSAPSHARLGAVSTVLRPTSAATASPERRPNLDFDWTGFGTDVLTVVDTFGLEGAVGIGHSLRGRGSAAGRGGTSGHLLGPLLFRARRLPLRGPADAESR